MTDTCWYYYYYKKTKLALRKQRLKDRIHNKPNTKPKKYKQNDWDTNAFLNIFWKQTKILQRGIDRNSTRRPINPLNG